MKVAIELDAAASDELVFAEPDGGRKPLHGAHPDKVESVPMQATDPWNQVQ